LRLTFAGVCLVAAAVLFWAAWVLMPGIGLTDAAQILDLVAVRRSDVRLSAIFQLASAVR
jgi:hypothetical protein